jgi:hypothetical protein
MSYSGFFIKVLGTTDYVIPLTLMQEKSYHGVFSTLDTEGYRDGDGVLHRKAVLQVPHATFTTRPLTNRELGEMWRNIRSRYTNSLEKKVTAMVYVSELDDYMTQEYYVPDIDPQISKVEGNVIRYDSVKMEFIGYGKAPTGGNNT